MNCVSECIRCFLQPHRKPREDGAGWRTTKLLRRSSTCFALASNGMFCRENAERVRRCMIAFRNGNEQGSSKPCGKQAVADYDNLAGISVGVASGGWSADESSFRLRRDPAQDLLLYFVGHGGVVGRDSDFYLAIRRTRMDNPRASGPQMMSLADTLTERARHLLCRPVEPHIRYADRMLLVPDAKCKLSKDVRGCVSRLEKPMLSTR